MQNMNYVKYVCQECGAEDTEKYFPNEQVFPYVSCFKCHSGQGENFGQMHQNGTGMKAQIEEPVAA